MTRVAIFIFHKTSDMASKAQAEISKLLSTVRFVAAVQSESQPEASAPFRDRPPSASVTLTIFYEDEEQDKSPTPPPGPLM